ncbi:metal ABC transporter permease [Primorskyibacter sp. S187A]|uniref:metal ABC transporter permease n=1 Tax=Primorskyibacter sp. S187A TaxID=3415130 RepID=UPI003C7CDA3B
MGFEFVALSLPPLVIGVLAAMACALPGNFLILRRQALIGDAISHVVLPGIVAAFLVTGTITSMAMLTGAAGAAIVSVILIEVIRRVGRIEAGAAMGVVFTAMFAAGVLLLELSDTSGVHLDVEHALYGNLESLIWLDATGWTSLLDPQALAALPPELPRLALTLAALSILLWVFWRPLVASTFDAGFARSLSIPVWAYDFGLVVISALAAVAAFDAVGSIIVIAMFICPPAAARLTTQTLRGQVIMSLMFAALSAIIGYVLAGYGPSWFGFSATISAAGMIATISGVILAITAMAGAHRKPVGQSA